MILRHAPRWRNARPGTVLLPVLIFLFATLAGPLRTVGQESASGSEASAESPQTGLEVDADPALPADEDRVLEDYEASEQISEDLSVSFPVDI
jgi:hypothetical protein